jgi:squalene-associated FAD-dependent desaturase
VKVGIVGGGLAGLAAGVELARRGATVEVFERSRLLGGRATSFEIDGVEVDNGQHVFLGCCNEFIAFVERLALRDALYIQDRFDALVIARGAGAARLRAASLPAPWHLVASFLRFRHLGFRSKFDVARALAAAARGGERSGETFASWLARHRQGEEALRVFWRPFFVPALNLPLEKMEASEALFTLRTAFLGDPGAARFGFSTVPLARIAEAAAARLGRVHRQTSVAALEIDGASHVRALVTTAGERHAFDAFVLALTPPQLRRLVGDPSRYGLEALDAFTAAPIVDVHLRYSGEKKAFDFAALVDSPVQWVFRKAPGYLVCSMSAADEYYRRTSDELVELAWEEVRLALELGSDAHREGGAVTRTPEATFTAPSAVERPGPETAVANVAVAGSWTGTGWPDTMESAVRSGLAAARRIIPS